MTEEQWLGGEDPAEMLSLLAARPRTGWHALYRWFYPRKHDTHPSPSPRLSDRKLRLYAAACCRLVWNLLHDGRSRSALEAVERYADGIAEEDDLTAAQELASAAVDATRPTVANEYFTVACAAGDGAGKLFYWATRAVEAATHPEAMDAARETDAAILRTGLEWNSAIQGEAKNIAALIGAKPRAHLLRDIGGNPFHAPLLGPCWRSERAVKLAQDIYEERAFQLLPELADLVQAGGCHDEDALHHCRSTRHHARGCWLIDAILQK